MPTIVSIHSYRGGTGKSNLTANLASSLVQQGKRVGVVDTDIQSPGLHVLFGMDVQSAGLTLNDYLYGRSTIEQVAHDVTAKLGSTVAKGGVLYLVPSSIKVGEITRVLREGYEVNLLTDGLRTLIQLLLVVNKVLPKLDAANLKDQLQDAYQAPVAGVLPVSEEMIELGSAGIFSLAYPEHPYSQGVREVAAQILSAS